MKKKLSDFDFDALKKAFLTFSKKLHQMKDCDDIWACFEQKYELNLNVIFLCCFLPAMGFQPLSKDDIKFILKRARRWHEKVIEPLRVLHRTVLSQRKNKKLALLADVVMRNEMLAEQVEQSFMLQVVYRLKDRENAPISPENRVQNNLFEYIRSQGLTLHNNDFEKVYRLATRCLS